MKRTYKYRLIIVFLIAMGCHGLISAQDPAFYGQHLRNRMVYNPAFAGDREIPGFSLFSRQQWLGWEGSPSSNSLMAHTRMKNKNVGLGVSLRFDKMGPVQQSGISGAYSYALQLSETSKIILGLQGELSVQQIRLSQLQLIDQGDQLFSEDPGMKLQPNAGLGVNYKYKTYSVYLSVPRLLNSDLTPFEGDASRWSRTRRFIYLGASAKHTINEDLEIEPSLLMALSRGNSPFIELAGLLNYQKRFGLGAFVRFNKNIGAMIRYNHQESFIFGYSYDLSLNKTQYNAGTHELYLGYNFPFNRTKNLSPRRF